MIQIELRVPSWIAGQLEAQSPVQCKLNKEVKEGTTIDELLAEMVVTCPGFRESVYNPDAGLVTEQIVVALNSRLLTFREISHKHLRDGDTIDILPLYYGIAE